MAALLKDRRDAGKKLGNFLLKYNFKRPIVLGLPRGGVIVAEEVAKILHCPMSVVISRKIGSPDQPELGIGALSEDEIPVFNRIGQAYFDLYSQEIEEIVQSEKQELRRRKTLYRQDHNLPSLHDFTVIVVDDGLATGATAVAAAHYLKSLNPSELVLAIPVAPVSKGQDVLRSFDQVISLFDLENFSGVGLWYDDFEQIEDQEVLNTLKSFKDSNDHYFN
jgi:predicted phosphoribosyltransferase